MHYFLISLMIVALDQWSKHFMSNLLPLCVRGHCESIEVLPVFKFTLLHNDGAAFGLLGGAGGWQRWFLLLVSTGVSLFLLGWLYRIRRQNPLPCYALCLILGGAVGNLIDRAMQGYVVDFLVFYYDAYYFPTFNVADAAISTGAGLLILDTLLRQWRHGR